VAPELLGSSWEAADWRSLALVGIVTGNVTARQDLPRR
jgi:hypothetical protein